MGIRTWTFKDLNGAVLLEMEEEFIDTIPNTESTWRNDCQIMLIKLKEGIEGESSESGSASKGQKSWWQFWR